MIYRLAILVLLLCSCSTQRNVGPLTSEILLSRSGVFQPEFESVPQLEERSVREGKHKYRPGHGFGLRGNTRGYDLYFELPISAWYSPRVNSRGDNAEQWNKLGGITYMNWLPWTWIPPNKTAVLVGFRPSLESGKFEIAAYINFPDKSWEFKIIAVVEPDQVGLIKVDLVDPDVWVFRLWQGEIYNDQVMQLDPMVFQYNVGPWFGGSEEALHDHCIFTQLLFD